MKRSTAAPIAALAAGAAALLLQFWKRSAAYDPLTGLTDGSHPSVVVLLLLTAAALVLMLVLARRARQDFPGGYDQAFYAPDTVFITLVVLSAVVSAAGGMLALLSWRSDLNRYAYGLLEVKPGPAKLVLCVLALLAACCLLPIGKNSYRGQGKGKRFLPVLAPAFAACLWLVSSYLDTSADPDLPSFLFGRMSAITALLALYYLASASFEKVKAGRICFFSAAAVFFSLGALAEESPLYMRCFSLFAVLYLTAFLFALCRGSRTEDVPKSDTSEVDPDES